MVVGITEFWARTWAGQKGQARAEVAKWEVLQAFTEAESQTACPQLLLKAGTGLEQPSSGASLCKKCP